MRYNYNVVASGDVLAGDSMTRETALPVEERILQLLQYLGIDQAHFAGRTPGDWTGLATTYPGRFSSFTLVGPGVIAPDTVTRLASRLLTVQWGRSHEQREEMIPALCVGVRQGFGPAGDERNASRRATPKPAESPRARPQAEGVAVRQGFEPWIQLLGRITV